MDSVAGSLRSSHQELVIAGLERKIKRLIDQPKYSQRRLAFLQDELGEEYSKAGMAVGQQAPA